MLPAGLLIFPLHLAGSLLDVAMAFMVVRLLTHVLPSGVLQAIDRVGRVGVNMITEKVAHHVKHWRQRPLSQRQKEVAALLVLWLARALLAALGA